MTFPIVIAGVDEVGIGCIAGPVIAAAVSFRGDFPAGIAHRLNDSKKINSKTRENLYKILVHSPDVHIGVSGASVQEIYTLNIKKAAFLAMQRAIKKLSFSPNLILVDGLSSPVFDCASQPIVKGDGLSHSIAAASIIAKVVRDRLMKKLAQRWSNFGWERNVGYPTAFHKNALKKHGMTPYHRQGYITIKQLSFGIMSEHSEAAIMSKNL